MGLDDQGHTGISWKELAAREESDLCFPESRLVQEDHYNEGEGWGFDRIVQDAMLQRHWRVDAEADQVHDWFRDQLIARGWELHSSHKPLPEDPTHTEADFYRRGFEGLILRVFWEDDAWLHYDVTFSDRSL